MYECYQCQNCNLYDDCPMNCHHFCEDRNRCEVCDFECSEFDYDDE